MTVTYGRTPRYQWQGLHADVKPTDSRVGVNDLFFETDTGNEFIYNGIAWAAYPGGVFSVSTGTGLSSSPNPITGTGTISLATHRQRTILIGDSLLGQMFNPVAVNTATGGFVVSNGIATINTSSAGNHQIVPGNYFQIWNASDATYAADINGATIIALTAPSATTLTFATSLANGDYSAAYGGHWQVTPFYITQNTSYFQWLRAFNRVPWMIVASYAQGGTTSANMVTLLPKMLAGPKFDTAFVQTGTNDLQAASTVAQATAAAITAAANITAIANSILAAGANVVIGIPPPLGASLTNALPCNIGLNQLHTMLLQLAQSNSNIHVIDLFANMILGTSTTGDFVSGYDISGDYIHPSTTGSIALSRAVNVAPFAVPSADIQPVTVLDDVQTYTSTGATYPNILAHGLMDGTGGSVSLPATGTAPTGWSISGVTGTAVAAGGAARTSFANTNTVNWGYGFTVSAAWTGNQGYTLGTGQLHSQIVPGSWYRAGFTVTALGNTTDLTQLYGQLFLNGTVNSVSGILPSVYFNLYNSTLSNGQNLLQNDVLEFYSEPIFIPANAVVSSSIIQIIVNGTNGGSANLEFASAFVRQIPNPYQ